jgi:hypothetical protein
MLRILALCLLWLSLALPAQGQPAQAQQEQPFTLSDPLAVHIVSVGTLEARMLGPYEAQVSIFSVPEPSGNGERLYVGLVEDIIDRRSPAHMWKGPVASGWAMLGPVPGYAPDVTVANPSRYRIQRRTVLPGGRLQVDLMEIDLSVRPAKLHSVEPAQAQTRGQGQQSLDELAMNESLRLLTRLDAQKVFRFQGMTLRSYEMLQGDSNPPQKRPVLLNPWDVRLESHLLAVSSPGTQGKETVYFLPMRPSGWKVRQLLAEGVSGKGKDRFQLEMFADYLVPNDGGGLVQRSARHLVSVGLSGITVTTLETGYLYDVATERWIKEKRGPEPGSGH